MEKSTDLAGPGVGSYEELEQILPTDYTPLLPAKQHMQAVFAANARFKWRHSGLESSHPAAA
jgi:hypothetical protein